MTTSREELAQHYEQLKAAIDEQKRSGSYPNVNFKSSDYDVIQKKDIMDRFANTGVVPTFYKHKLHVSLDLKTDNDFQKAWQQIILEIFKEPSVNGAKLINPLSDKDKRQPGKEITLYFLDPDQMNPKMTESAMLAEHLKVMKKLDTLVKQAGLNPSVPPKNQGISEFSTLELGCETGAVYISPPDHDESGKYVDSANRITGDHPYTAEYSRQQKMSIPERKVDYIANKMPILESALEGTLSKDKPFKRLVGMIKDASNKDITLDSLADIAKKDNQHRSKTGLFRAKPTESSDLVKNLSGLIKDVKNDKIGYVDFKNRVDAITNKLSELNTNQQSASFNFDNSNN